MNERSLVLNTFRPGADMELPSGFAGRRSEILQLVDALLTVGTVPVVYGDRGLGKTSLARQVERIALGDVELLNEIDANARALGEAERWTPLWVSCSDATRTTDDLLQRLINDAEGVKNLADLRDEGLQAETRTHRFKLKIYEAEVVKSLSVAGRKYSKLGIEDKVLGLIGALRDEGFRRLLIIVDELDRVHNTSGLASFIKNSSGPDTKFLLVGVSQTVSGLLDDHASLERQLLPVKVPRMTKVEQKAIVTKAIAQLNDAGVQMAFTSRASEELADSAGGLPWFVHVLGQEAMTIAFDNSERTVEASHLSMAKSNLATSRFAQHFSDTYQMAVRESAQRETVLRLMARWSGDDIPLSEVYKRARSLGISNPSVSKSDLGLLRHGQVIEAPALKGTGVVRFKNSLFKRYVNLRPSIFTGVKEEVDESYTGA